MGQRQKVEFFGGSGWLPFRNVPCVGYMEGRKGPIEDSAALASRCVCVCVGVPQHSVFVAGVLVLGSEIHNLVLERSKACFEGYIWAGKKSFQNRPSLFVVGV